MVRGGNPARDEDSIGKVGFDLYGVLGIGRRDVERMREQHDRNFVFFDAPVGMIFTIDRRLEIGSWLDYGIFLGNVMTAARGHGLHTCARRRSRRSIRAPRSFARFARSS